MKQFPEQVVDQAYFQDVLNNQVDRANWVYEEMWTYWKKKHPQFQLQDFRRHFSTSHCDLLEVYCSEGSQLTQQTSKLGLSAQRFSLRHGDLSTFQGRCKLYDVLWVLRPQHIWTAPRCGPWSNWNRFNASKSQELADRIMSERRAENVHLLLCDALFRVQDWRGDFCHFHLEQPQGSELVYQREMETIVENTFKAICDMCTAGRLKHPNSHDFLRKRTQILTTSEIVWRTIQRSQCVGEHHHDSVAGSCKPLGQHRMAVSKFSELYTATFGHRVGRAIQCSCQVNERTFGFRSQSAFVTEPAHETPEPKRRRLSGKFHPEQLFAPLSSETSVNQSSLSSSGSQLPMSQHLPAVSALLEMAEQCAPRVGKAIFQDGPFFNAIQTRYPDKQVVVVDVCRGVDRLRTCPIGTKGLAPFRRSFGKRRADLQVIEDQEWESWETLSRRQQIRSGTPAKIRVTIFATNKRLNHRPNEDPAEDKRTRFSENPGETATPNNPHENNPDNPEDNTHNAPDITSPSPSIAIPIKCQDHGPRFLSLDPQTQNMIKKVHQNLGHPDNRVLQLALRRAGWSERDIVACSDFRCSSCVEHQLPKVARPGKLSSPKDFNDHVSFDGAEWRDPQGKSYPFYHFIDSATNFHVAIPYQQRTTEGLIDAFSTAWLRWAGPPKSLMFDSTTEANSELFAHFLQEQAIQSYVIPTDAHWQLGRAERHGATLLRMIDKFHEEKPIRNAEDFNQCLLQLCHAKNAMSRHEGYTPELWVLGKMKPIPGSNMSGFLDSAGFRGLDCDSTEGSRFQEQLARREAARVAFIRADHCATLRRALHARSRPDRMHFSVGDFVMYWKSGKGVEPGSWHGPAKVLMLEQPNMVWISHMTRLFRCAPEHVRQLSADEAGSISQQDRSLFQMPERSGTGVFQFRELSHQSHPPTTMSDPQMHNNLPPTITHSNEPETVIHQLNNPAHHQHGNPQLSEIPSSTSQPDTEPPVTPSPAEFDPAIATPIPDDSDDDLVAIDHHHDYWQVCGNTLIRHHVEHRLKPFFPHDAWKCPVPVENLESLRISKGTFASGGEFQREENWLDNVQSHVRLPEPWTGQTWFTISAHALPHKIQDALLSCLESSQTPQHVMYAEIELSRDDFHKCLGKTYDYQESYLATAAKRQKVEVKLKDLSPKESELFKQAKEKEISSWLATDTVRRILRNKVPEGQLLRSRWVLTWKPLDQQEREETGLEKKAKARLVILGYEDPLIDSLPRDSPTLGRDSRMLALQCIASYKWAVRSFDIRTAFLRGSRQDSRILGVEPPPELRLKMALKDDEVCELCRVPTDSLMHHSYGTVNSKMHSLVWASSFPQWTHVYLCCLARSQPKMGNHISMVYLEYMLMTA